MRIAVYGGSFNPPHPAHVRAARLAYTLPQCRWIGWDLAFLADGDVAIIEGNWRPGTLAQNTHPRGIYLELLKLTDKL